MSTSPHVPGQLTYPEISAQTAALQAAVKQLNEQKQWIDDYIGNDRFEEVVFIGSGSSYYQALCMASTYRKWTGRSAVALPSSELFLFRDNQIARNKKVLVVGVSRSGESTEVILALEAVKELKDWTVCGISCYATSKMAEMANCLISPLGQEESTVMTKSFSSMTFMMQYAIAIASGNEQWVQDMDKSLALSASVVQHADEAAKQMVDKYELNKYIYLGMGTYFGLSQEAMLKIKEMSYVWTESYGTLEFRHGPKSIVDQGTLICLLVSEEARAYELKVAEEMKGYGATVFLLTAREGDDTRFADEVFVLGGETLSDDARSALYLPLLQYVGYYTALHRGVDPDAPRNLTQVVKI